MKKIYFLLVGICLFTIASTAQIKPIQSAIIKTPDALCIECKTRIENYLKRYDGLLEVNVNYRKGEAKVKYVSDRTDIEQIKAAIANAGYDADDVLAAENQYKKLPNKCKKAVDGGEHPKLKTVVKQ